MIKLSDFEFKRVKYCTKYIYHKQNIVIVIGNWKGFFWKSYALWKKKWSYIDILFFYFLLFKIINIIYNYNLLSGQVYAIKILKKENIDTQNKFKHTLEERKIL